MIEVTQTSRDFAADLCSSIYKSWGISLGNAAFMREGSCDGDPIIQAFERHRAQLRKEVAGPGSDFLAEVFGNDKSVVMQELAASRGYTIKVERIDHDPK